MTQYEPPIKIWIPVPSEIARGFGPNSTGKRGGNLRVRCTNAEYDAIQYEAFLLGIPLATFCRWCIVHVAQKLLDHREEQSVEGEVGEDG